ncbi:adenylate/guanylate cyclase domain-containing protein [Mycolicibacterium palauense]|uniref:adenylate/guanylate cyclase domain-containing protein n=1 Tax=Mycolicibacterium palauense TaxID=2034511 RepID=UPI000BFEBA9E|nr:adenylate/guanylate cyclase domain-containing protein [Mycolicibacterium palauense]
MVTRRVPPRPEGAEATAEEWARFYEYFGHARVRRAVRILSRLPSAPRCEACGNPFGGVGGWLMRRLGKGPSRKNPRWCEVCFETAPEGGVTLTIGVLFADIRDSTALAERLAPGDMAARLNRFYATATEVIVQHGIVDKLIGDAVMGLYFAPLSRNGRFVESMVADARTILGDLGYGSKRGPELEAGIGLDVGPAYVGIVGEGAIRDFTAIGDVVNTASRLQHAAAGGEVVMSDMVARVAGVTDGQVIHLDLKGKGEPGETFAARRIRRAG